MDPGEALGDDGPAPEVARLQCCVLPARALPVVLVSNHHPPDTVFLSGKRGGYEGEEAVTPCLLPLGFLRFTGQAAKKVPPYPFPKEGLVRSEVN